MMKGEIESIVNRDFKKPDAPRWESDKMDTRSVLLEHNVYLPFTWYKKLSGRRPWMQSYGRICVVSVVDNMKLPDQRIVST